METATKEGEWVEIEPGEWFYFLPMPLSDDEVTDRYCVIREAITELCQIRVELEADYEKHWNKRLDIVGKCGVRNIQRGGSMFGGDGRNILSVAPITTQKMEAAKNQLAKVERKIARLTKERFYLETWYPVTIALLA